MIRRRSAAAIAALVTLAVLGGSGNAAATWIARASATASASSATIASTLVQTGALNTTYRYSGSLSPAVSGQLTITNTGGAPLTYVLANQRTGSEALAQRIQLRLWSPSQGACDAAAPSSATDTTLADPAPQLPDAARTLDPGKSAVVCVSTQLVGVLSALLNGQSVTATFQVTGTVGTWTTTASAAAVTQSAILVAGSLVVPTCAQHGQPRVVLTWNAPTPRVPGIPVTYVLRTSSGISFQRTITSAEATVSTTLENNDLPQDGRYALQLETKDALTGMTTSSASGTVAVTRSGKFYECG